MSKCTVDGCYSEARFRGDGRELCRLCFGDLPSASKEAYRPIGASEPSSAAQEETSQNTLVYVAAYHGALDSLGGISYGNAISRAHRIAWAYAETWGASLASPDQLELIRTAAGQLAQGDAAAVVRTIKESGS